MLFLQNRWRIRAKNNQKNSLKNTKAEKLLFKDINGELPENRSLVMKYRASGSSLFVNAVKNGEDNIEEDTTEKEST